MDHRIEAGLHKIKDDANHAAALAAADAKKAAAYAVKAWESADKRLVIAGLAIVTAVAAVGVAYAIMKD